MSIKVRRISTACLALGALIVLVGSLALSSVFSHNSAQAATVDQLVGYGAGTTGGTGGTSTTVSTLADLTSAVSGSTAKIVYVSGTITGDVDVKVGSNTTILGVGSTGALVGISLDLDGV